MNPIVFVCWTIGVFALWRCFVAARRSAFALLSPTTIVVGGFFWIYVVGHFLLDPMTAASYLSPEGYLKVLVLAILSGSAFSIAVSKSRPRALAKASLDRRLVPRIGFALIAAGAIGWGYFLSLSGGFVEYYGAVHGVAGAWSETTAYLYGMIYFMFAGALLLSSAHTQGQLGFAGRLVLFGTLAFLSFDAWATGSRGHMLRLCMLAAVYLLFWRPRRPFSRWAVAAVMAGLPIILMLVPFLRAASYLGAERSFADAMRTAVESVSGLVESGPGSEVVYAAGLVQAAWEQGVLDYGYLWLHPLVNVVPRRWWPGKPYAGEFSVDNHLLVWRHFGWVPTEGAAPTGLADAFIRFSWASPVIWAVIGWIGGRLFHTARLRRDAMSVSYFCCYLIGLTYMVTQDLNAAIYSSLFMAIPLIIGVSVVTGARKMIGI